MRRKWAAVCLFLGIAAAMPAAEIQGVIIDWNCAKQISKEGRAKVYRKNRSCSMMKNYQRDAYGLITEDQKSYRLNDAGNQHVLELLRNSPDKDNLKVLVRGDVQGDTINVSDVTIL